MDQRDIEGISVWIISTRSALESEPHKEDEEQLSASIWLEISASECEIVVWVDATRGLSPQPEPGWLYFPIPQAIDQDELLDWLTSGDGHDFLDEILDIPQDRENDPTTGSSAFMKWKRDQETAQAFVGHPKNYQHSRRRTA